jgi:hypothetical protein
MRPRDTPFHPAITPAEIPATINIGPTRKTALGTAIAGSCRCDDFEDDLVADLVADLAGNLGFIGKAEE